VRERLRRAEVERARAEVRAAEERKRRRLAVALAAAVLLLVALGGGAAWRAQRGRDAEAAEQTVRRVATEREVTAALQEAATLIEQGWRQAERPDRWLVTVALARQAVHRAEAQLATGAPTEDLKARVAEAHARVAEAARDSRLRARLDDIRLKQAAAVKAGRFDRAAVVPEYRAELALYGVDPTDARAAAVVRRSRQREALLAALEDWAAWTPDAAERDRLDEVVRTVEPEAEAFRARWRAARQRRDGAALAALAREPQGRDLPAAAVVRMARDLRAVKKLAAAERLLAEAQERSPGDFWLNEDRGLVLLERKKPAEAVPFLTAALALRPDSAGAHLNLGNALKDKGDVDGAIRHYRRAIDLDPGYAMSHNNLGNALKDKGDMEGATRAFRAALDRDPRFAWAHNDLGAALATRGDMVGAIHEFRLALEIDARFPLAHFNLGLALLREGRFPEAREATGRWLEGLPDNDHLRQPVAEILRQCEQMLALEPKLPAVLRGEAAPASPAETADLAQVCLYKKLFAAAARLYADAFAADPGLADDLRRQHRYSAACAAALAAAGQGEDAGQLPDKVVRMLRRWALGWLRADLALCTGSAARYEPGAKEEVRQRLASWQTDGDLASIRDQALDKLPDHEREEWRLLWDDVARLARTGAAPPSGR
jgi:serine/threonine-protein kinase